MATYGATREVNALPRHDLIRLRQELGSPRLSALHSPLGLAVPRRTLHAFGSDAGGEAPPHGEVPENGSDRGTR